MSVVIISMETVSLWTMGRNVSVSSLFSTLCCAGGFGWRVGYVWLTIGVKPLYVDIGIRIESAADLCCKCLDDVARLCVSLQRSAERKNVICQMRWQEPYSASVSFFVDFL